MSRKIIVTIASLLVSLCVFAQSQSGGTYSSNTPYSVYGVGDMASRGSAYNKTMGGVGIANRSNKFINPLNPASITARDTLSVMADVSIQQDNRYFSQGGKSSVSNIFNIGDFMVTLPVYKSSAAIVGIMPYSSTGYDVQYPDTGPVTGYTGSIDNVYHGQGSMYQLFVGGAATFFKRLSLGAEYVYYFGYCEKNYSKNFTSSQFLGDNYDYIMRFNAHSGRFGVQYEQPVGKDWKLCAGATYTLAADIRGTIEEQIYSVGSATGGSSGFTVDTLDYNNHGLKLSSELGVGISVNYADKLKAEFNYTRADWRGCNFSYIPGLDILTKSGKDFEPAVAQAWRLGIEWTPNRNDIRYYMKRVSYRAGAYYNTEYYTVGGNRIAAMGVTLGATFPVFRWHNGITVGMDFGRRGTLQNDLVLERYINFSVGVNLFDIWFQKPRYE